MKVKLSIGIGMNHRRRPINEGVGLGFGGGFFQLLDDDNSRSGSPAKGPAETGAEAAEARLQDLEHEHCSCRRVGE